MLTQHQLKEIFSEYNFRPLKRYGENYLVDANIKDKIIQEASLKESDTILEIGPGFGALTLDLASSGARVYAVEKDRKAFSILSEILGKDFPGLQLIYGDILEYGMKNIRSHSKIKVIGNLPYYITTPIIEYLIDNRHRIDIILAAIQREVANRLLALPGTEDYSSISCFVRYYTEPSYIHTIRRTSFYPQPEVDSSLIKLKIRAEPAVKVCDEKLLFKIIRGAFNQRRKTITNSLSRPAVLDIPKERLENLLKSIGIDPDSRPELLGLPEFAKIANAVSEPIYG